MIWSYHKAWTEKKKEYGTSSSPSLYILSSFPTKYSPPLLLFTFFTRAPWVVWCAKCYKGKKKKPLNCDTGISFGPQLKIRLLFAEWLKCSLWMTKMFTVIYMWKCANDVVHVTSSTFWNVSRHQHVNIPVRRQHMLHPFGANNLAQLLCIVFWIDDYTCQSICCNSGPASWIFQHVAQLRVEVAILRQFIKDQMLGSP